MRFTEDPDDICKRFESSRTSRYNYDSQWHEIAARIWPEQDNFLLRRYPGEKRTELMYESTGATALERFGAVYESLMTARSQRWARLKAAKDELNENSEVREWFDLVNNQLFRMRSAPRANFYNQMQEGYKNLGAFGNQCIFVGVEPGVGTRYRQCGIGDTFMQVNQQGIPDTIFYRYELTAKAAVQEWGEKAKAGLARMPDGAKRDLAGGDPFKKRCYLHAVYPRYAFNPKLQRPQDMAFASVHLDLDAKEMISEGGYRDQPYLFSRYTVNATEDYGRGPAMLVLPNIRTLQAMQQTFINAGHLAAEPALLVARSGVIGHGAQNIAIRPGKLNWGGLDANGRPLIQPLVTGANMPLTEAMLERERDVVNDFMLVTLFQTLVDSPQMTATEVIARLQEKGQLLAPAIGRQQSELLGPLHERELRVLQESGNLPPPPPALLEEGGEYEVVYESPAQRMQRGEELQGINATTQKAMELAQFDPGIMEMLDSEQIIRTTQEISGSPPNILKTKSEYRELRAAMAQRAAAREEVEAMTQVAPAVSQLAQAMPAGQAA